MMSQVQNKFKKKNDHKANAPQVARADVLGRRLKGFLSEFINWQLVAIVTRTIQDVSWGVVDYTAYLAFYSPRKMK